MKFNQGKLRPLPLTIRMVYKTNKTKETNVGI